MPSGGNSFCGKTPPSLLLAFSANTNFGGKELLTVFVLKEHPESPPSFTTTKDYVKYCKTDGIAKGYSSSRIAVFLFALCS